MYQSETLTVTHGTVPQGGSSRRLGGTDTSFVITVSAFTKKYVVFVFSEIKIWRLSKAIFIAMDTRGNFSWMWELYFPGDFFNGLCTKSWYLSTKVNDKFKIVRKNEETEYSSDSPFLCSRLQLQRSASEWRRGSSEGIQVWSGSHETSAECE